MRGCCGDWTSFFLWSTVPSVHQGLELRLHRFHTIYRWISAVLTIPISKLMILLSCLENSARNRAEISLFQGLTSSQTSTCIVSIINTFTQWNALNHVHTCLLDSSSHHQKLSVTQRAVRSAVERWTETEAEDFSNLGVSFYISWGIK